MTALCLLAAGTVTRLATAAFTLGFVHSIEKIPIADDWIVEGPRLRIVESRIKGSGAGIEPGADARLADGWFRWTPEDAVRTEVVLRRSGVTGTGDWTICTGGSCRALGDLVPEGADPVVLLSCDGFDEGDADERR